jgi:fatty acid desaturase
MGAASDRTIEAAPATEPGHDRFLRALPPGVRASLTRREDGPGLRRLAAHAGLILALAALVAAGVPGWWTLILPLGLLIVFLFTLMHEAIHRTAFATRSLNDAVAWACGLILLLPPEWFRLFHFAHHRHTQDPEHDPELAQDKPETWPRFLWHVSGVPLWAGAVRTLVGNALGLRRDDFVPSAARARTVREARVMLAVYALLLAGSVLAGSALLFWIWVLPSLVAQPFLRIYLLAEHGRCPRVADMFANSRTTFTNRIVRWIAWNMPFHAEHHAFPAVPFHRLPDLHRLAAPHLQTTAPGYARFATGYAATLGPDEKAR